MGASLVAQWQRIHLPVQETLDPSLVKEAPTCTKHLNLCTTTTEPVLWGSGTTTTKPTHPSAMLCNERSHHNEKSTHHN